MSDTVRAVKLVRAVGGACAPSAANNGLEVDIALRPTKDVPYNIKPVINWPGCGGE